MFVEVGQRLLVVLAVPHELGNIADGGTGIWPRAELVGVEETDVKKSRVAGLSLA